MKLFKNKQKSTEKIIDKIEDLEVKVDELKIKIENSSSSREKVLEGMAFNAKRERIATYENQIKQIKNESACRETIIEQQQETIEKLKTTNQNLCGKAGGATKENNRLKKENEELKKKVKDLEKRVEDYDKRGIKVSEKVPGSTMPRKKQIVGIKPSKVSGSTKTELKKINELREKNEN